MASDIRSIDDQVKTLVENIKRLQEEIKTYQSGYKAFETASAALESLAKAQNGLTDSVASSMKELEKIDTVVIMKKIDETAEKLEKTAATIEKLSKELDSKEEIVALQKQNTKILERLEALDARLNEGVSVKKKKWFA